MARVFKDLTVLRSSAIGMDHTCLNDVCKADISAFFYLLGVHFERDCWETKWRDC